MISGADFGAIGVGIDSGLVDIFKKRKSGDPVPPSSQTEAFAPQIPGLDFGLLAALTSGSVPLLGLPLQQPSSDIGAEGAEAGMPSGGDQLSAEQQQALMALLQQQQSQFQLQQLFALNQHQHQLGQDA